MFVWSRWVVGWSRCRKLEGYCLFEGHLSKITSGGHQCRGNYINLFARINSTSEMRKFLLSHTHHVTVCDDHLHDSVDCLSVHYTPKLRLTLDKIISCEFLSLSSDLFLECNKVSVFEYGLVWDQQYWNSHILESIRRILNWISRFSSLCNIWNPFCWNLSIFLHHKVYCFVIYSVKVIFAFGRIFRCAFINFISMRSLPLSQCYRKIHYDWGFSQFDTIPEHSKSSLQIYFSQMKQVLCTLIAALDMLTFSLLEYMG